MARGINKVILLGNLAGDPEFKMLPSGTSSVATVSLATNESYRDQQGQMQERTEWHRLVFWGRLAEIARDYLHKGSMVFVEGKIRTRNYDDKQGIKRYVTEIHVLEMQMLGGNNNGQQGSNGNYQKNNSNYQGEQNRQNGGYQNQKSFSNGQQNPTNSSTDYKSSFNSGFTKSATSDNSLKSPNPDNFQAKAVSKEEAPVSTGEIKAVPTTDAKIASDKKSEPDMPFPEEDLPF